jgi:phage-related protein
MIWDLCHTIITLVKQLFGIKSPSTVFAAIGRDLVLGLINGIGARIGQAGQRAAALGNAVINTFRNAGNWLYNHGRNIVIGLGNGIASLARNAANRAVSIGNGIINTFRSAGSWLYNAGRNTVIGLINGIGSLAGNAANRAVSIANSVIGVFRHAGSWLYNHGRAIISGLINGISSKLGSLGSFLGGVGSFIQAHKGPIDKDRLLLVGAGQAIMGGLITGIDDGKTDLEAKLADVTGLVAGTDLPGLTAGADAAFTRSLTAASSNTLQASWAPGATGDPILDGLRRIIQFQYRGDVTAALSTG